MELSNCGTKTQDVCMIKHMRIHNFPGEFFGNSFRICNECAGEVKQMFNFVMWNGSSRTIE